MFIQIIFKNGEKLNTYIASIGEIEKVVNRKGYRMPFVRTIHFEG